MPGLPKPRSPCAHRPLYSRYIRSHQLTALVQGVHCRIRGSGRGAGWATRRDTKLASGVSGAAVLRTLPLGGELLRSSSAKSSSASDVGSSSLPSGMCACMFGNMSPDPIYPGREIFYFEANGVYVRPQSPNTSEPVYFAGTDPRDPGFPPPEDEAEVGNPRVQWESAH